MTTQSGDSKFDYRTRERALREGTLTKEELSKYLKNLPDESKKSEEVAVYEESTSQDATTSKTTKSPLEPTFSPGNEA